MIAASRFEGNNRVPPTFEGDDIDWNDGALVDFAKGEWIETAIRIIQAAHVFNKPGPQAPIAQTTPSSTHRMIADFEAALAALKALGKYGEVPASPTLLVFGQACGGGL